MIKNLILNWKTSSAGITAIAMATLHLVFQVINHKADENAWTVWILAIIAGVGLVAAGDASKSKADVDAVQDKVDKTANALVSGDTTQLTKPTDQTKP